MPSYYRLRRGQVQILKKKCMPLHVFFWGGGAARMPCSDDSSMFCSIFFKDLIVNWILELHYPFSIKPPPPTNQPATYWTWAPLPNPNCNKTHDMIFIYLLSMKYRYFLIKYFFHYKYFFHMTYLLNKYI